MLPLPTLDAATRAVRLAWDTSVAPLLPPAVEPVARVALACVCAVVSIALSGAAVVVVAATAAESEDP